MFDTVGQGAMPMPAFDPRSRYFELSAQPAVYQDERGRAIPYLRRRFLPQGARMPLLGEVVPAPGDRLDLIAARTLGDPLLAWRICDANDAMNPFDLLLEREGPLRVPLPVRGT
jgi:hypothetical protein